MRNRKLAIGASAIGIATAGAAAYTWPLARDPEGPKDCGNILPDPGTITATRAGVAAEPRWVQRGGVVNDASCLSRTSVAGVVRPKSEAELTGALAYARAAELSVSAAGVKHSMGGQAFRKGGLVLDMRAMNHIMLDPTAGTVTVASGATWHLRISVDLVRTSRG